MDTRTESRHGRRTLMTYTDCVLGALISHYWQDFCKPLVASCPSKRIGTLSAYVLFALCQYSIIAEQPGSFSVQA